MRPLSLSEIVASFAADDRDLVLKHDIPFALESLDWESLDYLGWRSDRYGFVCRDMGDKTVGFVFRFAAKEGAAGSHGMCNLCCSVRDAVATAMTDSWHMPRRAVGTSLCSDLKCSEAARRLVRIDAMGETITTGHRVERFQARLDRFLLGVMGTSP